MDFDHIRLRTEFEDKLKMLDSITDDLADFKFEKAVSLLINVLNEITSLQREWALYEPTSNEEDELRERTLQGLKDLEDDIEIWFNDGKYSFEVPQNIFSLDESSKTWTILFEGKRYRIKDKTCIRPLVFILTREDSIFLEEIHPNRFKSIEEKRDRKDILGPDIDPTVAVAYYRKVRKEVAEIISESASEAELITIIKKDAYPLVELFCNDINYKFKKDIFEPEDRVAFFMKNEGTDFINSMNFRIKRTNRKKDGDSDIAASAGRTVRRAIGEIKKIAPALGEHLMVNINLRNKMAKYEAYGKIKWKVEY